MLLIRSLKFLLKIKGKIMAINPQNIPLIKIDKPPCFSLSIKGAREKNGKKNKKDIRVNMLKVKNNPAVKNFLDLKSQKAERKNIIPNVSE